VGGDQETDQWIPPKIATDQRKTIFVWFFRDVQYLSGVRNVHIVVYRHTVHASQTTMHSWYMFSQPAAPKFDSSGAPEANPACRKSSSRPSYSELTL